MAQHGAWWLPGPTAERVQPYIAAVVEKVHDVDAPEEPVEVAPEDEAESEEIDLGESEQELSDPEPEGPWTARDVFAHRADTVVVVDIRRPVAEDDPSLGRARLRNTLLFDVLGVPAVSVPCGFDRSGMPVGLQIVGEAFAEDRLLALASVYERETKWHRRHPAV